MPEQCALSTLRRIREYEIATSTRAVTLCQQQYSRTKDQLDRLLSYRQEYRQMAEQKLCVIPIVYLDRQLFLQRLDDTILASRQSLIHTERETQKAINCLHAALQKSATLNSALDQVAMDKQHARRLTEQTQCDEQSRMVMVNRARTHPFD